MLAAMLAPSGSRLRFILQMLALTIITGFALINLRSANVAQPVLGNIWIGEFYGRIEAVENISARDLYRLRLATGPKSGLPPFVRVNLSPHQYAEAFQPGSVVRLRAISLMGSLIFVIYGVLIESVPIMVTNAAIAVLNVWFLRAELGGKRNLGATVVAADDPFLIDFLRYHLPDIHRFQPSFELPAGEPGMLALLLMRDGLPAGALVGSVDGGELRVGLDYVTKPYRDSQLSQWLYGTGSVVLRKLGVERVSSEPGTEPHSSYLARNGFTKVGERFERVLPR